jgi:hypothetical protein
MVYFHTLVARQLRDDNEDKRVCPVEDTSGPAIVPIVGNLTFHDVASIVSGACAIASIVIAAVLIARHAMNYSNPVQQRQILRVILLIPWVAIFCFLIVWQEGAGEYMVESLDFGCAIALSSFLLLMCDFVLSHRGGFEELFGDGARAKGTTETKGPAWLKVGCTVLILGNWVLTSLPADMVRGAPAHPHEHYYLACNSHLPCSWNILQAIQ